MDFSSLLEIWVNAEQTITGCIPELRCSLVIAAILFHVFRVETLVPPNFVTICCMIYFRSKLIHLSME
jgi:hypothetical protein